MSLSRRARGALALATVLTVAGSVLASGAAQPRVQPGFRVANAQRVAKGVVHFRLESRDQRVHVARIQPDSPYVPRVGVARGAIGPRRGTQRTSAICRRADCAIAVNGDFYYEYGRPAGAVVVDGEPWITTRYDRPHLIVNDDGSFRIGRVGIPVELRVRYPHDLEPVDRTLRTRHFDDDEAVLEADGINARRPREGLVVYTPRRGKRTYTGGGGVEIIARLVGGADRLALDRSLTLRLIALREGGNAAIPRDGVVLSGSGTYAQTLRAIWKDVGSGAARSNVKLRVRGPSRARQVIGGRPILVRNGNVVRHDDTWFEYAPNARTAVGWDRAGVLYLVTVDAARGARGMSLNRLGYLMKRMGVVDAINLDGGGSTTFVRRGVVRNEPRWGSERSVGSALLIVRDR